jgi:hypothetical protein
MALGTLRLGKPRTGVLEGRPVSIRLALFGFGLAHVGRRLYGWLVTHRVWP